MEEVLAHRRGVNNLGHEYLIKWKGYPEGENTWVPMSQLVSYLKQTFFIGGSITTRKAKIQKTALDVIHFLLMACLQKRKNLLNSKIYFISMNHLIWK